MVMVAELSPGGGMTRDDIIRMAREVSFIKAYPGWHTSTDELERFAALVAAHEREACAQMADLVSREIGDINGTVSYIAAAIRARGNNA